MTEQIFSSVRWPVELYMWVRERAHERRQSINKTIVEIVEEARGGTESERLEGGRKRACSGL